VQQEVYWRCWEGASHGYQMRTGRQALGPLGEQMKRRKVYVTLTGEKGGAGVSEPSAGLPDGRTRQGVRAEAGRQQRGRRPVLASEDGARGRHRAEFHSAGSGPRRPAGRPLTMWTRSAARLRSGWTPPAHGAGGKRRVTEAADAAGGLVLREATCGGSRHVNGAGRGEGE